MDTDNERPVLTIYRTNGLMWAAFALYEDGVEEPYDIFASEELMLAHAQGMLPNRIEYRPQELGCEANDEELAVIPRLAAVYDARIARNQQRLNSRAT